MVAHQLLSPRDSPGKNTVVGCHFLLQGIFPTQKLNPGLLHCRQIFYQLSFKGSPRIFINANKELILERFNKFLVGGRVEIKTEVWWLQKTCSKSLYGTFPNTLNYNAYIGGNSYGLKFHLSRKDTNEKWDKPFRLEWLNTTWDVISAMSYDCNIGRITLLTLWNWGLKECAHGCLKYQLVTSTNQKGSESQQAG